MHRKVSVEVEVAAVRRCDSCQQLSEKLQRCAGCAVATYCSKDCQRQHWRAGHKNSCKTFSKGPLIQEQIAKLLDTVEEGSSDEDEPEDSGKQARLTGKQVGSSAN